MRWYLRKSPSQGTEPRYHWHRWWAWYPVEVDGQRVWLEHVMRKGTYHWGDLCSDVFSASPYWTWEYSLNGLK